MAPGFRGAKRHTDRTGLLGRHLGAHSPERLDQLLEPSACGLEVNGLGPAINFEAAGTPGEDGGRLHHGGGQGIPRWSPAVGLDIVACLTMGGEWWCMSCLRPCVYSRGQLERARSVSCHAEARRQCCGPRSKLLGTVEVGFVPRSENWDEGPWQLCGLGLSLADGKIGVWVYGMGRHGVSRLSTPCPRRVLAIGGGQSWTVVMYHPHRMVPGPTGRNVSHCNVSYRIASLRLRRASSPGNCCWQCAPAKHAMQRGHAVMQAESRHQTFNNCARQGKTKTT